MTTLSYSPCQTSPLRDAVERLTIPDVATALGLGELEAGRRCRSPFYRDTRPDFAISRDGRTFHDHGNGGEHRGGLIDFVVLARSCSRSQAADILVELAGVPNTGSAPTNGKKHCARMPSAAFSPSARHKDAGRAIEKPAPGAVLDAWRAGCEHLTGNDGMIDHLCRWRRWRPSWILALARAELMGCPTSRDRRRLVAFAVSSPSGAFLGYHQRQRPTEPDARASWHFVPTGVPSLPFVLGNFATATGLVIVEGQWDAITLAGAAGWLDAGEIEVPAGLAVVGLRGAGSWRHFVERYPLSAEARALLIPDDDNAGLRWTAGADCFAAALRKKVRSVSAVHAIGGKDINDAHKEQALTRDDILSMLEAQRILPRARTSPDAPPAEPTTMSRFSGRTLMELHKLGPLEAAERESIGWAVELFEGTVEPEGTR
jgi:hypothetical protein